MTLESPKEIREHMAKVTGRPIKLICILTSHWPQGQNGTNWYTDLMSELNYERDVKKHPVIINSFIKKARLINR